MAEKMMVQPMVQYFALYVLYTSMQGPLAAHGGRRPLMRPNWPIVSQMNGPITLASIYM